MQVQVNGQSHHLAENATLHQLLDQLALREQRIAVEVNTQLVPRSTFDQYQLQSGDQIEIIHAVGGG